MIFVQVLGGKMRNNKHVVAKGHFLDCGLFFSGLRLDCMLSGRKSAQIASTLGGGGGDPREKRRTPIS